MNELNIPTDFIVCTHSIVLLKTLNCISFEMRRSILDMENVMIL